MNKNRLKLGFVVLSMVLAGCNTIIPASGPSRGAVMQAENYDLISISTDNIAHYLTKKQDLKTNISSSTPLDYHLSSGDVINIAIADNNKDASNIFSNMAVSGSGTVFEGVRIDSQGNIAIPYVQNLNIRGLTLAEAQRKIQKHLKQYAVDPQVYITFNSDLGASVLVAGNVGKPGRYSLMQGPLTLIDVISQAGGPSKAPYLIDVVVRNGKTVNKYNYQDVLDGLNFTVSPGSEIILTDSNHRFIAMGAVQKVGLYDFTSAQPNLLEVLGSVGGLNDSKANVRGVFVFRMPENLIDKITSVRHKNELDEAQLWQLVTEQTQLPQVFLFNMRDPMTLFLASQFAIEPNDTIYVSTATVTEFQKLITPIIQVLLLGNYWD